MNRIEGVTKYHLDFSESEAPEAPLEELNVWRGILFGLGLIGQQVDRYAGAAYGNVSQRCASSLGQMIISASQTGGLTQLDSSHYSLVQAVEISQNRVTARGRMPPSSEALTHAMLYRLNANIQAVFHIHDPRLWHYALDNGYPATGPEVEYGTVAMARAMERLYQAQKVADVGVMAMRGHQDGVLSFGYSVDQAGARILRLWLDAHAD